MAKAVAVAERGTEKQPNQLANYVDRTRSFFHDVRSEMHKVVVPSRKEVESTTTVVIITTFLFAAFFYVVDALAGHGIERLLHFLSAH